MTSAPAEISDDTRQRVRRAWALLLPRADAIADSITLTLLDSSRGGWYEAVGPDVRADLRTSTRDHVRRGLRTMAGLATEEEKAVHLWRETGRQRARQGVPMELVLNAYAVGSRALWEALMAERHNAPEEIDDAVLLAAGRQIWAALDIQCATMAEAYRRESARIQRRDLQRQQRLLDVLLDGRYAEEGVTVEARELLGLDPDEPLACIVMLFDGMRDMRSVEDHLDRLGVLSYWHVRGDRQVGVAPLRRMQLADLISGLSPVPARVGVATSPDGLSGLAVAYRGRPRRSPGAPPPWSPRPTACPRSSWRTARRWRPSWSSRRWARCWSSRRLSARRCSPRCGRCWTTTARPRTRRRSCTATATPSSIDSGNWRS